MTNNLTPNVLKATEAIIRQAGDILLEYYRKPLEHTVKDSYGSFVTDADLASEKFLIKNLGPLIPGAAFFAEESGSQGSDSDYCWVIDPLDGTTNFSRSFDYFCISVALTYQEKPIAGFVYRPTTQELFFAQKGGGAFLNGKKITISTQKTIEGGFFVSCLPYGRGESFKRSMDVFTVISQQAFGMRNVGAAALDGAYTAAGIFDGVFFQDLGWWDIAACSLLIQEAGGMVTDYSGKPIDKDYQSFLGGNREVYTELQPFLKEIVS